MLYDEREASPGVKFADADLIGVPLWVTMSARSLERGGVEVKRRDGKEVEYIAGEISGLREAVQERLSLDLPPHAAFM